jgi:predicted amidohydrolase YtcJ
MLDAGAALAGSSDSSVVGFDVLAAMDVAVRRELPSGAVFSAPQRISIAWHANHDVG